MSERKKNPAAVALGSIKSERKAAAVRENGKRGGYWTHKARRPAYPKGIEANSAQ